MALMPQTVYNYRSRLKKLKEELKVLNAVSTKEIPYTERTRLVEKTILQLEARLGGQLETVDRRRKDKEPVSPGIDFSPAAVEERSKKIKQDAVKRLRDMIDSGKEEVEEKNETDS